jgi:hypothetical protein
MPKSETSNSKSGVAAWDKRDLSYQAVTFSEDGGNLRPWTKREIVALRRLSEEFL